MAMNRSTFTKENDYAPDIFTELYDLNPSQLRQAQRYKILQMQQVKSPVETEEFNTLKVLLQSHLITAEKFNHFQNSLYSMQLYLRDDVFDHVDEMKQEISDMVESIGSNLEGTVADFISHVANEKAVITTYINGKKVEINLYVDDKLNQMQLTATETINVMQDKKDHFLNFVKGKESEIIEMVQDLDSRSIRYYQRWSASTDGQTVFNIYAGQESNLPAEAKLILSPKDLDVVVQGTDLTPGTDYDIVNNGLHDSIELKGNAASMISAGTEITMKWYKNVGKLYFRHAATHELGGSDEIKNIQEAQLSSGLTSKINNGNITISTIKPTSGMWYKVIG